MFILCLLYYSNLTQIFLEFYLSMGMDVVGSRSGAWGSGGESPEEVL
jgi:hypothetical protein